VRCEAILDIDGGCPVRCVGDREPKGDFRLEEVWVDHVFTLSRGETKPSPKSYPLIDVLSSHVLEWLQDKAQEILEMEDGYASSSAL
jgi:hypothetical protein